MTKVMFLLVLLPVLLLGGFTIYKSLPQIQGVLKEKNLFPQVQQLIAEQITPTSPDQNPTPQPEVFNQRSTITPTPIPPVWKNSDLIKTYLAQNIGIKSQSGKVVCAYRAFDSDSLAPAALHLFALCQEYYKSDGKIQTGSGLQTPIILKLLWKNGEFQITGYAVPGLGDKYASDTKSMFPKASSDIILSSNITPIAKDLQKQTLELSQTLVY